MLGLVVPSIGLLAIALALWLRSFKSAQTGAVMVSLNIACTAYQMASGNMLSVELFTFACVIGAAILLWQGPRKLEFVIMILLALNIANYGSYYFIGGDSEPWRVNGNWLILAIYALVGGGAVYDRIIGYDSADEAAPARLHRHENGVDSLEGMERGEE